MKEEIQKEFKPSSWAIQNRVAVFVLTTILALAGISAYQNLPKESFPDISLPNIYVSVIYPGTSPKDMENLIVRPIEKECKSIAGVKKSRAIPFRITAISLLNSVRIQKLMK